MPDDVGGRPFPDGDDHGRADDEFASVVFDEDFVRSAAVHEPTARERLLAAAQARAEAATVTGTEAAVMEPGPDDDDEPDDLYTPGRRTYGGHSRWHRSVAWLLAVLMGVGVVALTFAAVYRGAGGGRQPSVPPPTSGPVGTQSLPPVAATPLP